MFHNQTWAVSIQLPWHCGLSAEGTPKIQVDPIKIPPVALRLPILTVLLPKIPFRTERRRDPVTQDEQLAQGQERIRGYVCVRMFAECT